MRSSAAETKSIQYCNLKNDAAYVINSNMKSNEAHMCRYETAYRDATCGNGRNINTNNNTGNNSNTEDGHQ